MVTMEATRRPSDRPTDACLSPPLLIQTTDCDARSLQLWCCKEACFFAFLWGSTAKQRLAAFLFLQPTYTKFCPECGCGHRLKASKIVRVGLNCFCTANSIIRQKDVPCRIPHGMDSDETKVASLLCSILPGSDRLVCSQQVCAA
jgi:hypothetical protein